MVMLEVSHNIEIHPSKTAESSAKEKSEMELVKVST
jgi:hypothetical protein